MKYKLSNIKISFHFFDLEKVFVKNIETIKIKHYVAIQSFICNPQILPPTIKLFQSKKVDLLNFFFFVFGPWEQDDVTQRHGFFFLNVLKASNYQRIMKETLVIILPIKIKHNKPSKMWERTKNLLVIFRLNIKTAIYLSLCIFWHQNWSFSSIVVNVIELRFQAEMNLFFIFIAKF